jgi:hypothetical protein
MNKFLSYIVLFLLGAIGWILWYYKNPPVIEKKLFVKDTIIVRDTIKLISYGKIIRHKIDTLWVSDTAYLKPEFISRLDTTLKKTEIAISYSYPQNVFEIEKILVQPDTIILVQYIPQLIQYNKPEPWYVKPSIAIGSFLVGYVLGKVK